MSLPLTIGNTSTRNDNPPMGGKQIEVLRGGVLIAKQCPYIVSLYKLLLYNIYPLIYAQNVRDYYLSVRF